MNEANHYHDEVLKKWRAILEEELAKGNERAHGIRSALNEITVWISGPHRKLRLFELGGYCSLEEASGIAFALGVWVELSEKKEAQA